MEPSNFQHRQQFLYLVSFYSFQQHGLNNFLLQKKAFWWFQLQVCLNESWKNFIQMLINIWTTNDYIVKIYKKGMPLEARKNAIQRWKVLGALQGPNGLFVYSKRPYFVINAVFDWSVFSSSSYQYTLWISRQLNDIMRQMKDNTDTCLYVRGRR